LNFEPAKGKKLKAQPKPKAALPKKAPKFDPTMKRLKTLELDLAMVMNIIPKIKDISKKTGLMKTVAPVLERALQ